MDVFTQAKRMLKKGSGKCVVLKEEHPMYVVMTWDEYERLEKTMKELRQAVDIDINAIPIIE